ncbi:precorrin-3B synthase [Geodermatophilus marinus]|uniref:precorrin-3B synthase n=1 Tax=Geodermatophilus sp. LHW52908 TaxID=2303986 RepID=UPI000E3D269A|nr:precorrin-3B synthase [Geodermatophilus sp. LHW52908]RFU22243.1 precorrin-3B synthase [Geodermatophilus sp. LHW52908]
MSTPAVPGPPARSRPDACPGALQTHPAADGFLARVRVPGGLLTADRLRALARAAAELGDGALELTSRGNVQLRGLADGTGTELAGRLGAAGLLPSPAHDRVRNVLASVLTGRAGGLADVRPWVRAVDAGLCTDPRAAELPGRFLVTLDDGRGDVAGAGGDAGLRVLPGGPVALTLAGRDSGLRCGYEEAPGLVLAAISAFLDEHAAQGGTAWRLAELADGPRRVAGRLGATGDLPGAPAAAAGPQPAGEVRQDDGRTALVAVVPLGRLTADQAAAVAGVAAEVQLTPWRGVAVPDLDAPAAAAAALTGAGLVLDPGSPWLRVTACTGRPGCARSLADVRADAAAAVAAGSLPAGGARQHWAGCARRCGRPAGDVVDVVATGGGYRVG